MNEQELAAWMSEAEHSAEETSKLMEQLMLRVVELETLLAPFALVEEAEGGPNARHHVRVEILGQNARWHWAGNEICAVRGCRALVLADTEDWPAQLCPEHAPIDVLDQFRELERRHGG